MGRIALFTALAVIVAGMTTLMSMKESAWSTAKRQARFQEDVIARNNAETAHQVALSQFERGLLDDIAGADGLTQVAGAGGGFFQIRDVKKQNDRVTFTAEGRSAGASPDGADRSAAVHRITSTFERVPAFRFSTPLAATGFPTNFENAGGTIHLEEGQSVHMDMSGYKRMSGLLSGMLNLLNPDRKRADMLEDLRRAGLSEEHVVFTDDVNKSLRDAFKKDNPSSDEEVQSSFGTDWFYQEIVHNSEKVWDASRDMRFEDLTLRATEAPIYLDGTRIVHVGGSVTLERGSAVRGKGVLIVEGDFIVQKGATFEWDGAVLVRSERNRYSTVDLQGDVTINGALFAKQDALDPGGHMDVTVWGDPSGDWKKPYGALGRGLGPGPKPDEPGHSLRTRPWWEHTHKYDKATGSHRVPLMVDSGAPSRPYRARIRLAEFLRDHADPNQEYYLAFTNAGKSGYAHFGFDLSNSDAHDVTNQAVASGFKGGTTQFRSPAFKPGNLRHFAIDIGSLRNLRKLWNEAPQAKYPHPEGKVTDYPVWVGNDHGREGAFTVQLRRAADGKKVYEAAIYWHKKPRDEEEEKKEEKKMAKDVAKGGTYGLDLKLGKNAAINGSADAMLDVAKRFGMTNLKQTRLIASRAEHWNAGDADHAYLGGSGGASNDDDERGAGEGSPGDDDDDDDDDDDRDDDDDDCGLLRRLLPLGSCDD